jgi:hypothetical protein
MPNSDRVNHFESIGGCPKFFRKILVEEQTDIIALYGLTVALLGWGGRPDPKFFGDVHLT